MNIKELLKKSIEDKLKDIKLNKPVPCQHLDYSNKSPFCKASQHINNVEKCIYKVEFQSNPMNGEVERFYCNSCFQLKQEDVTLIYLGLRNHPVIPFGMKQAKTDDYGED